MGPFRCPRQKLLVFLACGGVGVPIKLEGLANIRDLSTLWNSMIPEPQKNRYEIFPRSLCMSSMPKLKIAAASMTKRMEENEQSSS